MLFVYVDDFGHVGPDRAHPRYNTSPVFGFGGFALPEEQVQPFSSFFLLKLNTLSADIARAGKPAFKWEKKGTNLFTKNSIVRYPNVRECAFRLMTEIRKRGGFVFYFGREKARGRCDLSPIKLQTSVLAAAIRRLDHSCNARGIRFALIMDQCSTRPELLDAAQKTMFGQRRCRHLVCPPFEVESHLDQNMQAADWIATLVGRLWAMKLDPLGFQDYSHYQQYFWERMHRVAQYSTVRERELYRRMRMAQATSGQKLTIVTEQIVQTTTSIVQVRSR